jgi:anti-sigma-K factor RskA
MDHEEYKAMLPLRALSTLESAEGRALDQHLVTCAECRTELTSWHETAGALAHAAPPLEPSAAVRDRILESVRTESASAGTSNVIPISRPTAIRPRTSLPKLQAIAAAVIFLALIIGLFALWQQNRQARLEAARLSDELKDTRVRLDQEHAALELFSRPGIRMAELAGTKDAPAAHAMMAVDSKSGRAVLMAQGLPPAPAGKAYQLWFIAGNQPMPGKVFKTDAAGNAMIDDQLPAAALNTAVFAVTLEPQSGVPAPTGPMYLLTPSPARS